MLPCLSLTRTPRVDSPGPCSAFFVLSPTGQKEHSLGTCQCFRVDVKHEEASHFGSWMKTKGLVGIAGVRHSRMRSCQQLFFTDRFRLQSTVAHLRAYFGGVVPRPFPVDSVDHGCVKHGLSPACGWPGEGRAGNSYCCRKKIRPSGGVDYGRQVVPNKPVTLRAAALRLYAKALETECRRGGSLCGLLLL